MKLRKQYYKFFGNVLVVATQITASIENYTVCIKELNNKGEVINEWIRPETSPFMDGIKKEMCFLVQAPIDDTVPLKDFEVNEFI